MAHSNMHRPAIAFGLAILGACGASPAAKFYTLSAAASVGSGAAAAYTVGVGPVSVPSAVGRPQFVVQTGPNRVEIDEFSRWAAPLEEEIARAVAGNLEILLGTRDVAVAPLASLRPAYRVVIDVQRFDSVRGEAVLVDAVWAVRRTESADVRSGHTLARESVQDESSDALAAAHSRALARVSSDIATAIQQMAEARK